LGGGLAEWALLGGGMLVFVTCHWRRASRQILARKLLQQLELARAVRAFFQMFGDKRMLAACQRSLLIGGQFIARWAEHAKELLTEQLLHLLEHARALGAIWTVA